MPNLKFIALTVPEIIGGTQKTLTVPGYAHTPFSPKFLRGFCSDKPLNIPAKFEVRSFMHSWDNRGYWKNCGQSLDMPTLPYLQNFSWACVRMDTVNVSAKFAVHSCSHSWDNTYCSFEVGLRTPNLGEREAVGGRGWHRAKERWWLPIGSP